MWYPTLIWDSYSRIHVELKTVNGDSCIKWGFKLDMHVCVCVCCCVGPLHKEYQRPHDIDKGGLSKRSGRNLCVEVPSKAPFGG